MSIARPLPPTAELVMPSNVPLDGGDDTICWWWANLAVQPRSPPPPGLDNQNLAQESGVGRGHLPTDQAKIPILQERTDRLRQTGKLPRYLDHHGESGVG